eukprot:Skav234155  [mRNA]  locus=scaffold6570:52934:56180:- [translate_table: standard]
MTTELGIPPWQVQMATESETLSLLKKFIGEEVIPAYLGGARTVLGDRSDNQAEYLWILSRRAMAAMPNKDEHAALIGLPDRGRRIVALTKHSTVDTLIYGRDLDNSGDEPHRDFMRRLIDEGYAGEPSGHRDAKMANRKLRTVLNIRSQMSQHLSEQSPHEEFMTKFADRAGCRNVEARFKPLRGPGLAHTQSMYDLLGQGGVVRTPRGIRVKELVAAGGKTDPDLQRFEGRACAISTKWTRSTLRLGDLEHPGALGEDVPDRRFSGHAGQAQKEVKSGKVGSNLKSLSAVDKLLYGRDLSGYTTNPGLEYAAKFGNYAGFNWKLPKQKSDSCDQQTDAEVEAKPAEEPPAISADAKEAKSEAPVASEEGVTPQDPKPSPQPGTALGHSVTFETCPDLEVTAPQEMAGPEVSKDELPAEICDATLLPATLEPDLEAKTFEAQAQPDPSPAKSPATPVRRSPFAITPSCRSPGGSSSGSRTPSSGQRPRWQ